MVRHIKRIRGILLLSWLLVCSPLYAEPWRWGNYGSRPIEVLDSVRDNANDDRDYRIQDTALDQAMEGVDVGYEGYTIRNTIQAIIDHAHIYLQWMLYIGLSVATILLIYNGLLMVTGAFHKSGDFATIKKNLSKIAIGILLMTGFWWIVKLLLAGINMVFSLL